MNITGQSPYFGSFDPAKQYTRVLFKPEFAVQARELNDMQSMLQYQTGIQADHIFKNGSRVSNARTALVKISYVRLQPLSPDNTTPDLSVLQEGLVVRGEVSGVEATLVTALPRDGSDPDTLYVQYVKTGIDGVQRVFVPGEPLSCLDRQLRVVQRVLVKCQSCAGAINGEVYPTGTALFFTIDDGIFYYNKTFVGVHRQQAVLSKYPWPDESSGTIGRTKFAGLKIGLDYVEDIVTAREDAGLLDNALGYPNESQEGADRLRSRLIVAIRGIDDADAENFILIARVDKEGRLEYMKSDAEYSEIMDAIAKRTYETNGNYTVRPFKLKFIEHRRAYPGDPLGWIEDGDPDKLVAVLSASVGYVLGYRTETTYETPVVFSKAREAKRITGAILPFEERAYVVMTPGDIVWPNPATDTGMVSTTRVALYSEVSGGGTQVGSFLVYNAVLHAGIPGTPTAQYRYYINDVVFAPGHTMNDVNSAMVATTGFAASPVRESGRFEVKNPLNTGLVFKLPFDNVKTLRSLNTSSPGTMIMTVRKKFKVTLNASGQASIQAGTNQSFSTTGQGTVGFVTSPANVTKALEINPTTVTASSQTIDITLGNTYAGHTVTLLLDVLVTNQTQNNKSINEGQITTQSTPPSQAGQSVMLGVVDAFELVSVKLYDYTDPQNPVEIRDVTDDWTLVSGTTDFAYQESKIVKKSNEPTGFTTVQRLRVEFKSFAHSGSAGFYTVDSYAQMLVPDVNGDTALTYETLPSYTTQQGATLPLAASLDFRPDLLASSNLEPVIPATGSTAIFEVEYYLGRADLISLRRDGTLYSKAGIPSETPALPTPDEDSMPLYQVWLKPYGYSIKDVSMKFIENKRYTMRDIGKLEDRIGKLEYYTVLTMLESQTASMQTKDSNGLDRFKNGFLTDDFSGLKASDLLNPEFRAAVDPVRKELRPGFKSRNNKLVVDKAKSSGVKWLGSVGMREYSPILVDEQPFATKHISVNPYFQVAKVGKLVLTPNIDTWSDDTILPPVVTEIDTGVEALTGVANAAGVLGTTWGSWAQQNSTLISSSSWSNAAGQGGSSTFQETFTRTGVERTIGSRTQTFSTGETVRSVQIIPYVRPAVVQFAATSLKPNTKFYAFFDNEPVSEFCRAITVVATGSQTAQNRDSLALGSSMYSNANGEIVGEFHIPEQRFFTGQKSFRLTTDPNFSKNKTGQGDEDAEFSFADALYFAGGLDVTKQESTLNLITPTFSSINVSESETRIRQTSWFQAATPPVTQTRMSSDPVAQSFTRDQDTFITGVDLYFHSVDAVNNQLWVELRSMINGYPSTEVLSRRDYLTDSIPVSEDAQTPFHVEFEYPTFIRGGTEYCFVVGGYTPDTRIWVARMGGEDVFQKGKTVETQPTMGSSFRSQNGSTWNAEQFEDIKYKLYAAEFSSQEMRIAFANTSPDRESLEENPIETQSGSSRVRIFHPCHGFAENDKVMLELLSTSTFMLEVDIGSTPPHPGQVIRTSSGVATVVDVTPDSASNRYTVKTEKIYGRFDVGQEWTTEAHTPFQVSYLLESVGVKYSFPQQIPAGQGNVITGSHATYPSNAVNGIPVDSLQKEHTIVGVDSTGSYIIDTGAPATFSSRVGGTNVSVANTSVRYDVINVSGSVLPYSCNESWQLKGIGHGRTGKMFASDNYRGLAPIDFKLGSDVHLSQPMKLANLQGEQVNAVKSIEVTGVFDRFPSSWVSPVVNTDAFSSTLISSIVGTDDAAGMNVIPNASNRWVDETDVVSGTASYKYVSQTAKLQNPASDLRILVDAYCDVSAEFDVYIKTLGASETGSIDDKPWQKVNLNEYAASVDLFDFKEHDVITSANVPGWIDQSFIAYKVKLVGRTENTCKPPLFKNLRVIAVT